LAADPHIFHIVDLLDHWQTLIGAAVGGGMGAAGALIVAGNATHRERRIAATMVLPEVMSLQAANEAFNAIVKNEEGMSRSRRMTNISLLLLKMRPKIRALHGQVTIQLYDLDARLYAHLFHCQMIHEEFESTLKTFGEEVNAAKAAPASVDEVAHVQGRLDARAAAVMMAWDYSVEHAALANYYLDRFIFRRWPVWMFKTRMRLFPNDLDRRSKHLLKTGEPLSEKEAKPPIDDDTLI
jgi:hypothetical protein